MQKWEYLTVWGLNAVREETHMPKIIRFTDSGLVTEDITDSVSKRIAEFGNEGWELVCVEGEGYKSYHFKRPKK